MGLNGYRDGFSDDHRLRDCHRDLSQGGDWDWMRDRDGIGGWHWDPDWYADWDWDLSFDRDWYVLVHLHWNWLRYLRIKKN